jgi:autotransporter passenger strand-loop-strand repeat protein
MATYYNVYSGTTKTGLTANAKDVIICVSKGGTAIKSDVGNYGEMVVYSGGIAISSFIQTNGVLHVSTGAIDSFASVKGGEMNVNSGGKASSSFIQNNGTMFVYAKGIAIDTVLSNTVGKMYVSGGSAIHPVAYSNSLIELESRGVASRACLFGGKMTVYEGCKAVDTEIDRGGSAIISSGGSIKNTHISAYNGSGGELHVRFDGKAAETTVDYKGKMYVSNGGTADKTYLNGSMYVSLGGTASRTIVSGGSMVVSNGGSATKTTVSGGSMIVSQHGMAINTTVLDGGKLVIASDGTATKATVSGTMIVSNGGTANTVTGRKALIEVSAGASASNVVASGGTMFISKGATVTNLTNKGADIRVEKGAVVSNCKGNPLEFADRDGGWNEYEKGETPSGYHDVKVENIPDSTKKIALDTDGSVSMNGMINFVGYEDEYDYGRINLINAANLSFKVEATGKAKFTIWRWDGSKMISVQSTALKKDSKTGLFTVTTKKCLLEKENEYYISVQALNVKTGGFAYYNVHLNREDDNCIFYNHCDDSENYWMVDSKKNLNNSADIPTRTLSLGESKTLQVDVTALNYRKTWNNFVGHNDDTDYAKIKVTQNLKTSFTVEATDAAKFTVYQIVNNNGKYSLKSVKSKALAKQKDGTFKATLSIVSLKSGNDYCVCMTSTNAKKGGNAYYNVTYTAVSADSAALTMPETDSLAMPGSLSFGRYDADALADASAASLLQNDSLLAPGIAMLA